MADHDPEYESLTKQINEHDPSSIHFEGDKKAFRIIGKDKSVHHVLGGGKSADVLLWRDKKRSAIVVGIATTIWMLFELFEYHLISLTCNILIFAFTALFLWSNLTSFINRPPPRIPEFRVSDETILRVVSMVRGEINRGVDIFRDIVVGGNLKKFLGQAI
ncbi:reticulon-like protein B6 [Impatiens glandulifera]|uniref:reticulon-like protein B6 n=1 Tax=Impatiens glandulifera TaxID=253017 RepID=UPI001FB07D9B|nr:reticulon-like protein B6 [Impatiens glandulifera]